MSENELIQWLLLCLLSGAYTDPPLRPEFPQVFGDPADLDSACANKRLKAYGRFGGQGKRKRIKPKEFANSAPKGWTDILYKALDLQRAFHPVKDCGPNGLLVDDADNPVSGDTEAPAVNADDGPHKEDDEASPPILQEQRRRNAFLKWAKEKYGEDWAGMPGRNELKQLGRKHVAPNINEADARWLRRFLPRERTKGGAAFHLKRASNLGA